MTIAAIEEKVAMKKPTASANQGVHSRITVAQYISQQLDIQASMGKTQKEIATELGYTRPNMISMLRREEVKLPFEKVPALARALNVDPAFLFRLAVAQYIDSDEEAFVQIFGRIITDNEFEVLDRIRKATKGTDPKFSKDQLKAVEAAVK